LKKITMDGVPFLYLRENEVQLRLTMPSVIEAVATCFRQLAAQRASNVPRYRVRAPGIVLHSMSASAEYLGLVGWKQYTTTRHGARFHVAIYDHVTGQLKALIEADRLGQMRTGAATAVAARHLSPASADALGMIGCGWQAESQLEALHCVRPLREARVYSPTASRRRDFAERMSRQLAIPVVAVDRPEQAVRDMPLVVTITSSKEPVLRQQWLAANVFLAAVGSNWLEKSELDVETVAAATRIVCDCVEACRREAGELALAAAAGAFDWDRAESLSAVVAAGQSAPTLGGLTLFKSVGLAIEDVATAATLLPAN
jgi:alanine dehydrogenase